MDTPHKHFHVYLYSPGKGIKLIRSYKLNWRYLSRTYASINNNGLIAISYVSGRRSKRTFIYSIDGTDLTPTTIFNAQGRTRRVDVKYFNDSDVLGSEYAITFSLTDRSQRTKTEDLLANLFTSDSRVYITIDDINNANVLVGHSSVDVKSRAGAFYPDTGSQGIAIDDVFSDWDGLQSYSDSLSDGATVNWETAWAHDDGKNLFFSYKNTTDINQDTLYLWSLYLDTDHNSASGYNFELLGADTLLQGKNLYQYTGSGADWSWKYIGDVSFAASGARAELSIQKSKLGMADSVKNYRALFYGANPDGSNLDYLLVDLNEAGGSVIMEEIAIPESS
jgi:hypothetical protein